MGKKKKSIDFFGKEIEAVGDPNEEKKKSTRKPYSKRSAFWKLFRISPTMFFLQTYNKSETPRVCPSALVPLLDRAMPVAHTRYRGSKFGYITTYLLRVKQSDLEATAKKHGKELEIHGISGRYPASIEREFNVASNFADLGRHNNKFKRMTLKDILDFCENKPIKRRESIPQPFSKNPEGFEFISWSKGVKLIKPGAHTVVKDAKGIYANICQLDIGIDTSTGCVSNTRQIGNTWFYDPEGKCGYCYAHQNGPCSIDTLFDLDEAWIVNRINEKIKESGWAEKPEINIRIGQTVEANMAPIVGKILGFQDNLKITLKALTELRKERKVKVAMPSKVIKYDKKLSRLFKSANVTLLASVGYEQLETGIVGHGFSLDRRLKELLKYAKDGVTTGIFIMTNITRDLDQLQPDALKAMDFYEKNKKYISGLQFLDARVTRRKHAPIIAGINWDDAKYSKQARLFASQGYWRLTGQNYLAAMKTDPEFLKLVGKNRGDIRLCSTHVVKKEQRCGKCFMDKLK